MSSARYAYSWEGVVAVDFTLDAVRRRYAAFADILNARGWSCLIAYDTRFLSAQIAIDCYRGLTASGARVVLGSSALPRPAVDVALDHGVADCALLVSAGNRDAWYNGLVVVAPAPGLEPLTTGAAADDGAVFAFDTNDTPVVDARQFYIDALRAVIDVNLARRALLTVFVDVMNGTTSGIIPAVFGEGAQTRIIEINRENDAWFGRQTPHPREASLVRLRKLVRESDSHLGVAFSADGRALAVVDNDGEVVPALEIALLLGHHLNRQHRQRGVIVAPAAGEPPAWVRAWETHTGLSVEFAATAAARIAEARAADQLLLGYTDDGEPTIGHVGGVGDATLAALLLVELVARRGEKLRVLREKLRQRA